MFLAKYRMCFLLCSDFCPSLPPITSYVEYYKQLLTAINWLLWLQSLQCCQRDIPTHGAEPLRGSLVAAKIHSHNMEKVVSITPFWPSRFKSTTPQMPVLKCITLFCTSLLFTLPLLGICNQSRKCLTKLLVA